LKPGCSTISETQQPNGKDEEKYGKGTVSHRLAKVRALLPTGRWNALILIRTVAWWRGRKQGVFLKKNGGAAGIKRPGIKERSIETLLIKRRRGGVEDLTIVERQKKEMQET